MTEELSQARNIHGVAHKEEDAKQGQDDDGWDERCHRDLAPSSNSCGSLKGSTEGLEQKHNTFLEI